jgi:hypothetical protein
MVGKDICKHSHRTKESDHVCVKWSLTATYDLKYKISSIDIGPFAFRIDVFIIGGKIPLYCSRI